MVDCRYRTVLLPSRPALGDWGWFGVTFRRDEAVGVGDVGMGLGFLVGGRVLLACPMVPLAAS